MVTLNTGLTVYNLLELTLFYQYNGVGKTKSIYSPW